MPDTYVLRSPTSAPRPFKIDYAAELNEAQHQAVSHVEGPLLVIAGAGSGKTRTLVFRVARLVELGVRPRSILLLTFTRRASEAMLRRASELVGSDCGKVAGGTFHSFSNLVLRRNARDFGVDAAFTILDRGDSEDVLQLLRTELGFDRKERRFPKKQTIGELFSMAANKDCGVASLVESDYGHLADHVDDLQRLAARYREYKKEKSLFDYDDLLIRLRDGLREKPELARRLADEHRFILVDEYQDTNRPQAEIVEAIGGVHGNVMAVGDDAQSIYAFRGANFRNIMDFPSRFPGSRLIALEENYRSTQPILDLANAVIERAPERYTKVLRTTRERGMKPLLVRADTENDQSRFVAQRILELREEGVPLDEIAVLFRSSFHSFDLEIELTRADIPFVKRGGFRFIESAHVKDVLAHLRVLANPRDVVSWLRVLCLLDGVGPKKAAEIAAFVESAGRGPGAVGEFPRKTDGLAALGRLLKMLAEEKVSPGDAVQHVVAYYTPILRTQYADDHPKRERDLDHLSTIAARYRSFDSMLSDFALEPPSDSVGGVLADDEGEGRLVLSTIHSAKGLEWHTVFLLWAAEGKFPSAFSGFGDEEIEEERRLCYVAVTRAKEQLYLSYPAQYYDRVAGLSFARPSRFVEDLPATVLAPVAVVEESAL
jgi:DNA helicase II / ATP-dependent DNA helicase PcrA